MAGPPPRLRLAAVRRRRPSPSSGTRASARCGSSTDPAQRPQRVDWGLLLRSGRDTRRCCRALAPASSIQIPRARSAVELQPAAVLCARALETWFGDLSATTRRLAPRREVRARPAPREGTRPFLARSGKSLSSPAAHASLPLPLPPYPVLACDTLRPHAPRLSSTLAGGPIRRATPCMITAGGSGARATADSASPHALWPAAARCRAPFSSPLANGPKSGL